ncbi:MAG: hypothetical protein AB2792_23085 [Candidatus Thiodiazotropha sp.]
MSTITNEQYLMAKGLWYLANEHQSKCVEYETALNNLLGLKNGSHVSDSIYNIDGGYAIDDALKKEGIQVET